MARYCRICTDFYAVLIPILNDLVLIDRINAVTHVKVSAADQLSTLICNPCLEIIATLWEFYEHVQQTYETSLSKSELFDESLCRMCHCGYDNLRELVSDTRTCKRISVLYRIKIDEESKVPNVVCKPCVDAVNFSWTFLSDVQKKQIFLKEKFDMDYEDENLSDLNVENDSNASDVTNSDDLLQELYVEPVVEKTKTVSEKKPRKKKRGRKKKRLLQSDPVNERPTRLSQRVVKKTSHARNVYLNKYRTRNSLLQLDGATTNTEPTIVQQKETNKDRPVDPTNDAKITTKRSTSKEFPLIKYDAPIFFCDSCSVSFDTKHALFQHKKRHRLCFYCICCRKLWGTALSRNQHEEAKFVSAYGDRQCKKCLKIFNNAHGLAIHQKLLDDFHTACDLCPKAFVDANDLSTHEKAHERSFSRSCRVCSQDFATFGILGQHEMSHKRQTLKNQLPYECAICGSCFDSESQIQEHILTHKFKHVNWETFSNLIENSVIYYENLANN